MTNLFSRIYSQTLFWLCITVLVGGPCSCNRPDTSLANPPSPPKAGDAALPSEGQLIISPKESRLQRLLTGPYRVEYTHIETGMITDELVVDFTETWPIRHSLSSNLAGRFQVIVYQDDFGDRTLNDCPFPATLGDSESLRFIDNIQAKTKIELPLTSDVAIQLQTRTCGLGASNTGFAAKLRNQTDQELQRLMLYAEGILPALGMSQPVGFAVPIEPGNLAAQEEVEVSFGELLPGTYTLTVFTDNDGDGRPSPCNLGLGGGDRFAEVLNDIEIRDGEMIELNETFEFASRACPDDFTGIRGFLSLSPTITLNAQDTNELGLLSGSLRIRFNPLDLNKQSVLWTLSNSITDNFLPRTFSVTGLEPGQWNVTVFLDRDENQSYTPCDGLPSGFDTIWSSIDNVEVTDGKVLDMGNLELNSKPCGQDALSGIRGEVLFPVETGSHGSGRPVRMELRSVDTDSDADQISILLLENHWLAEGRPQPFIKEVEPGQYLGRIYLDSNRDGVFTPCVADANGDRSYTEEFMVTLEVGEVTVLGQPRVDNDECIPVDYPMIITIDKDPLNPIDPDRLHISILEQGGWALHQELTVRSIGDVWTANAINLASGRYAITIYLDDDGDDEFNPCTEGGNDGYAGQVEMNVGTGNPAPQIQLSLSQLCPD